MKKKLNIPDNATIVLENDDKLPEELAAYIKEEKLPTEQVCRADRADTDVILDYFAKARILLFQPTLITYSQYNLMMMALYKKLRAH